MNEGISGSRSQSYRNGPWAAWAAEETRRRETIRIYEAFFSLQQAIETQGAERPLELVWGVGIARWQHPKELIDHPIIEQLVEVDIDPDDGAVRITARSTDPSLAIKPYHELLLDGADRLQRFAREHFRGQGQESEFSPFIRPTFEPVLRQAVALLNPEGRYHPDSLESIENRDVPLAGPSLVITDTWVIFARPRSANIVVDDIERLKTSVQENNAEKLPATAKRLVSKPDDTRPVGSSSLPPGLGAGIPVPASSEVEGGTTQGALFFPKPFNEEQIEIVRQLEREDGVVVQGPPGTGKTHTIANIICHYMATGRRVLVVSHGEAALGVLRDQIPEEIRELAISLLTNERQGLKLLEKAVRLLADDVSQQEPRRLAREINDGEQRVLHLKDKIINIEKELRRWAELHLKPLDSGKGTLPMDLARRVVEGRARHAWFKDRPEPEQKPKIDDADIARLRQARRKLGPELVYVGIPLPSPSDLPEAATLGAIHEDLATAERIADRARLGEVPPLSLTAENALVRAEALGKALDGIIAAQEARVKEPWLQRVFDLTRERDSRVEADAFDKMQKMLALAADGRRQFLQVAVDMPDRLLDNQPLGQAVLGSGPINFLAEPAAS